MKYIGNSEFLLSKKVHISFATLNGELKVEQSMHLLTGLRLIFAYRLKMCIGNLKSTVFTLIAQIPQEEKGANGIKIFNVVVLNNVLFLNVMFILIKEIA